MASLQRECWEPTKLSDVRTLRAVFQSVLAAQGAYIVFTHVPLTPQKIEQLRDAIGAGIRMAGADPAPIAIDIYDANAIARWVNTYPAVACWVLEVVQGKSFACFQSLTTWSKHADFIAVPWADDDQPRFGVHDVPLPVAKRAASSMPRLTFPELRDRVIKHVATQGKVARIVGASGLGKTRLVHAVIGGEHSLQDRAARELVLFSDLAVHENELLPAVQALAESGRQAILIVDECPDAIHAKLVDMIARADAQLSLISIDIETRRTTSDREMIVFLDPAKDGLIDRIVSGCAEGLSHQDRSFIRELADGFPSMAVRATSAVREARDPLLSVDDLVERILWGRALPDQEAAGLRCCEPLSCCGRRLAMAPLI